MVWFAVQSLPMLAAAFLLGLLVGWVIWARPWVPVEPQGAGPQPDAGSESDAGLVEELPVTVEPDAVSPHREDVTVAGDQHPDLMELLMATTAASGAARADDVPDAPETLDAPTVPDVDVLAAPAVRAPVDDLTMIDGVTPTMAAALAAEGFATYTAVAHAGEDQLRRALRVNRIRSAPGIGHWSVRAGELAAQGSPEVEDPPDAGTPGPEDLPTGPIWIAEIEQAAQASLIGTRPEEEPTGPIPLPGPDGAAITPPDAAPVTPADAEPVTPADGAPVTPSDGAPVTPLTMPLARPVRRETVAGTTSTSFPWSALGAPSSEEDLSRITGLDPAAADALRHAGIANYTRLAATRDDELRGLLEEAGLPRHPTLPTWSVQAALLLQGDEDGARTLAGGLMVGREPS